jgi:hypothetical protein
MRPTAGGVMGKMIDAQSICIATAATNQASGGSIFRFVFWHSVSLAPLSAPSYSTPMSFQFCPPGSPPALKGSSTRGEK